MGIGRVVISPGSRSAPLVMAFSAYPDIEKIVIPDERVAAFFALGMAQQLQQPVVLICTSGTAVLNFAPAIAEAYHQQVPLLVLTADRPPELIGKGENQAIYQSDIYRNYIKKSYATPCEAESENDIKQTAYIIGEAIRYTTYPYCGPVHVNVPIREPLYIQTEEAINITITAQQFNNAPLTDEHKSYITEVWAGASKKMIICGMDMPDEAIDKLLYNLAQRNDTVVITENISNHQQSVTLCNPDVVLDVATAEKQLEIAPDILITIGKQFISKKLRQFLKAHTPAHHWQVSMIEENWDGLGAIEYKKIQADEQLLLSHLDTLHDTEYNYRSKWRELRHEAQKQAEEFVQSAPYSDLRVIKEILNSIPNGANLQLGNSTPIRYSNFFNLNNKVTYNCNRGTSGIDGVISTAAGAAHVNGQLTVCLTGDVSFFYDSNALWNNYLSPKLRIVVINNGGGNIFRLIDGPVAVEGFEKYFETKHSLNAEHLARMFGLGYYFCADLGTLQTTLPGFMQAQQKAAILEVKTNNEVSADVYKQFFKHLRSKQI